MNRKYEIKHGVILVEDDDSNLVCSMDYVDNFEDRLIVQNQLEELNNERQFYRGVLQQVRDKRKDNVSFSRKVAVFSAIPTVLLSVGAAVFNGGFDSVVNTCFGDMNNILGNLVFVATPFYLIMNGAIRYTLDNCPSKKREKEYRNSLLACYEESVLLRTKLLELESDNTTELTVCDGSRLVDDRLAFYRMRDAVALKRIYVEAPKKIQRLYSAGKLNSFLVEKGFFDYKVLGDFEDYVANKISKREKKADVMSLSLKKSD